MSGQALDPDSPSLPAGANRAWQVLTCPLAGGGGGVLWRHAPHGPAKRPVLYLHGIQSHPGWYVRSAQYLARQGHPVYQLIRRGSGEDANPRGHAPSVAALLADVSLAADLAMKRSDADAFHLLGVSWGGKLAAAWALDGHRRERCASLTMACPGLAAKVEPSPATKLAIAAALLVAPRRRFQIPLSDPALFTDNPAMRDYLRADPHRLHRATARMLYVSRQLDTILRRAPRGSWGGLRATLILAQQDRIIDNQAAETMARRLSGDDLDVRTLPGCHSLEFEPDPRAYFDALAAALA